MLQTASAALCLAYGANACREDLCSAFWGDWKGTPTFPWKLIYLTFQCNLLHLLFGWAWLVESLLPGATGGLIYKVTHFISGLGTFVTTHYYLLIHFDPAFRKEVRAFGEAGGLVYRGKQQPIKEFFKSMNRIHGPLLALATLPLIAMDRQELGDALQHLQNSTTITWIIGYGFSYAGLVQVVYKINGWWVYPFMAEFTHLWHHLAFYTYSFGIFAAISTGYRRLVLSTSPDDPLIQTIIAIVWLVTVACIARASGELKPRTSSQKDK